MKPGYIGYEEEIFDRHGNVRYHNIPWRSMASFKHDMKYADQVSRETFLSKVDFHGPHLNQIDLNRCQFYEFDQAYILFEEKIDRYHFFV